MKRFIYLIRHGEVNFLSRRLELNERGRKQAERLGRWMKENYPVPNLICSSDRPRAIQTAKGILRGLKIKEDTGEVKLKIDKRFQEFNFPVVATDSLKWRGKTEAVEQFIEAMTEYSKGRQAVAIISHSNIIQYVLDKLFNLDRTNTPHTSFTAIEKQGKRLSIERLATVDHLMKA
ncbi:histidine phosphatase family protein [Candidatus Collierbacteria bacterium]|nr:histidine phosphatase family protein [Candidatus Collierbacteria bacterium]